MGCVTVDDIAIICRPEEYLWRQIRHCPTCERRRRFVGREAIWYGTTVTCCGCGDSWTSGERHERPFMRDWRTRAIASARQTWTDAGVFNPSDYSAWLRAQIRDDFDEGGPDIAMPGPPSFLSPSAP